MSQLSMTISKSNTVLSSRFIYNLAFVLPVVVTVLACDPGIRMKKICLKGEDFTQSTSLSF